MPRFLALASFPLIALAVLLTAYLTTDLFEGTAERTGGADREALYKSIAALGRLSDHSIEQVQILSASELHLILEGDTDRTVLDKALEQLCRKIPATQRESVVISFATGNNPVERRNCNLAGNGD
ncbi:hypothetical protein [Kiloniella sp. b19]|uniref:hypothetical protein n=1 Tax=Kiloniella sp. GXU_MW_B19 TaxID=3141326 RepID=UPI0031CE8947